MPIVRTRVPPMSLACAPKTCSTRTRTVDLVRLLPLDLRRNIDRLPDRDPLEIATRDPVTVSPDCFASEALALVNARKVQALLVVDDDRRPAGVLHLHDLLRAGVV
ncbi:MAG: CBS domain-containing protein [Spiribacter salinus]|uniref:CBS domain-containing protein n=1 Tax=Spiribacter salinus TaxID=1335746 RepID=A0A540V7U5_9GAMM|nr:MAG: CBS domain-containing protein [Spiribacter salinus]